MRPSTTCSRSSGTSTMTRRRARRTGSGTPPSAGTAPTSAGTAQPGHCVRPDDLAAAVTEHLPHLRCALLLGCETWPAVTESFVQKGVPVVAGMQFAVRDREHTQAAACEFLRALVRTRRVDDAFRALRAGFIAGAGGASHHAVWPVLHVYGEGVELVAADADHRAKIKYARTVVRELGNLRTFQNVPGDHPLRHLLPAATLSVQGAEDAGRHRGGQARIRRPRGAGGLGARAPDGDRRRRESRHQGVRRGGQIYPPRTGGLRTCLAVPAGTGPADIGRRLDPAPRTYPVGRTVAPRDERRGSGRRGTGPAQLRYSRLPCATAPGSQHSGEWVFLFDGLDEMWVRRRLPRVGASRSASEGS